MRSPNTLKYLILSAAVLSGAAAHQLPLGVTPREDTTDYRLTHGQRSSGPQKSLQSFGYPQSTAHRPPVGHFTKKEQDNATCPTYGESQWTGIVTVGDGRGLFYWYFDSRNDPENDPIILWMNGGPGGSSMMGLITEMGPCWLEVDADHAVPNPWSWNNNASLLFLDQPAGAGLSHLDDSLPLPTTEQDTAQDFQQFLNIFFSEIFPEKKNLPIHIATESYGGHYGPVYLNHILESRRYDSKSAFWGNITSLTLVNAVIDWTGPCVGAYKLLCEEREKVGLLNATACESIARNLPEQQRLGRSCEIAYKGDECRVAYERGQSVIHGAYLELVNAGKRYLGNIQKGCTMSPNFPFCTDPDVGNYTEFFNQEWVKKAVDKTSPSFIFRAYNMDMHLAFRVAGTFMNPTTRELVNVLDEYTKKDKVADIRVLVLNGNNDYILNSPGNIWQYDRLGWSGQAEYSIKKWQPLPDGLASATGSWKATRDGRLAFVAVDDAGHTVPGDVREGSYLIMQEWLRGGWRM